MIKIYECDYDYLSAYAEFEVDTEIFTKEYALAH
jgi:hypothetical protein